MLSSLTCQLGVFAAERGQVGRAGSVFQIKGWGLREWFVLTYCMGAVFIAGQATEYASLVHEGITIPSSAYGTMFYLTTGFHGLHVTGGLVAFLFVLGRTFLAKRFTHEQAVSAIVVSYYWHFVDVVWIGAVRDHLPHPVTAEGQSVRLLNRPLGRLSRHRRGPVAGLLVMLLGLLPHRWPVRRVLARPGPRRQQRRPDQAGSRALPRRLLVLPRASTARA